MSLYYEKKHMNIIILYVYKIQLKNEILKM